MGDQPHEQLIVQLEKELGSTVRRLEKHRTRQVREAEGLARDLERVTQERNELRAKLELSQDRQARDRTDFDLGFEKWTAERRELEQRLAASEANLEAARAGEKRLMVSTRKKERKKV